MKRRNLGWLAGLFALVAAISLGSVAGRGTDAAGSDEAAVRAALLQNAAGFEKNDLPMVEAVWAHDESVTVFESGHANRGWADYRDHHLAPEMKEFKNTKFTLSDINIKVSGSTAWATFQYTIAGDVKDRRIAGQGLGTAVLEQRAGRWLIVHQHTSSPRRPPAAPPPTPKSGI